MRLNDWITPKKIFINKEFCLISFWHNVFWSKINYFMINKKGEAL